VLRFISAGFLVVLRKVKRKHKILFTTNIIVRISNRYAAPVESAGVNVVAVSDSGVRVVLIESAVVDLVAASDSGLSLVPCKCSAVRVRCC